MSARLIQSFFFLSLCTTLSGMNQKQYSAVRSLLNENHHRAETPKIAQTIIQPLINWTQHRPTIIANQTNYALKHKNYDQVIANYKKVAPHMPDDLSILKPATKKAYQSIEDATKKIAFEGNSDAQQLLTEHGISKLYPLFNDPHPYALELLDFTLNLKSHATLITATGSNKQKLTDLRDDTTNPTTAYIVATIFYLHATNDTQKNIRLDMLQRLHCPEHPEIEALCQFVINYGDTALSVEDATKKFMQTVQSQKNVSYTLSKIANTPLCSTIIAKLENASLKENDPSLSDLHSFLAELYYKCKNYTQADNFYTTISASSLKEKKIERNAFIASIATSKTFGKEEIAYLSSLYNNIGNQLKKLEKTDPHISYNISLLTQALINNSPSMNVSEKIPLILNALDHLAYTQKKTLLSADFHTLLSTIYDNDSVASLKQMKLALEHRLHCINNTQDREIFNILCHAEQSNPDLYLKLAPWTKNILHVIHNQPARITKQKNYTLLSQLDSCELLSQLLPYCEPSYITNKISCDDMVYLMALTHKNCGNYHKAYEYIHKLSQPLSDNTLLLKAQIYTAAHKTLPDLELKTVLHLFNNTKKPGFNKQEAILSLMTSSDDNSGMDRYIKAVFILDNSDDEQLINHALELLEENIQKNSSAKVLSQFELAYAFCNYNEDPTRIPILQKYIPCDIDKAITYLTDHNNNAKLLMLLATIFGGTCSAITDPETRKKYINLEKAIEYITLIINSNENYIDYLLYRKELYNKLNNPQKVVEDIDLLLNAHDLSNGSGITRENLLYEKANLLITNNPDDNAYDQVLECFKQIQSQHGNKNIIFASPTLHARAMTHIKNKNMTDNAIEWCCLEAESQIYAHSTFAGKPTQEQKDFASYLLSAAKMGNSNAKLLIVPYIYAVNYLDDDTGFYIESFHYAHEALFSSNAAAKTVQIERLIQILSLLAEIGEALPYYILCDYYKDIPKKLENLMLLFSKAKEQYHNITRAKDTVEKIRSSCWDTLYAYATHYMDNPTNGSAIRALAIFTLGSMCLYCDDQRILTAGTFYLSTVEIPLCTTFKLPHYKTHINTLLAIGYYNNALLEEKNNQTINLELLRKSAQRGYLQAAHKMAEIYIEQQKNGTVVVPVTVDDFFNLLAKDITMNSQNNKRSVALFAEYNLVTEKVKEAKKEEPVAETMTFIPMTILSVSERVKLIRQRAYEKNMIKYKKHQENSHVYNSGIDANNQNNHEKANRLFKQAATKEQHPNACIMLVHNYLTGQFIRGNFIDKDYSLSGKSLRQAFSYGLVKKTGNDKTKQFHNIAFLHTLFCCITSLVTSPHPLEIKSNLLSIIKNSLSDGGINIKDFCEIFQEVTTVDLSSVPEWMENKEKKEEPAGNNIILTTIEAVSFDERMKLIAERAHKKNIIKYKNHKESSFLFNAALKFNTEGKHKEANALLKQAATKEKHPNACIMFALNNLTDELVTQDYSLSEKFLALAFFYGLIQKTGNDKIKQFHSVCFLHTLFCYITSLTTASHPLEIKSTLLSIIKKNLVDGGINLLDFYEILQKATAVDLPSVPEWNNA